MSRDKLLHREIFSLPILLGVWAVIIILPIASKISYGLFIIFFLGISSSVAIITLNYLGILSRTDLYQENQFWQNLLLFLTSLFILGLVIQYSITILSDFVPALLNPPANIVLDIIYIVVPVGISIRTVYGTHDKLKSWPSFLIIEKWDRRSDAGLVLIVVLVSLIYGGRLVPAESPSLAPFLNLAALLFGLFHVVCRRSGIFFDHHDSTHTTQRD